jgi:hypothetical protein
MSPEIEYTAEILDILNVKKWRPSLNSNFGNGGKIIEETIFGQATQCFG